MFSCLPALHTRLSAKWFVVIHTIAILVWGVVNVQYYPVLRDFVLYFWLIPSLMAAACYSVRIYVVTVLQVVILSTVVVMQNPATFSTSLQTILFVNGFLLIVFEFIFSAKRRQKAVEALHQKEVSVYRSALSQADFVAYERDYRLKRFTFVGDGIEALTGYSKEEWTPELWDYMSTIETLLGEGSGLSNQEAVKRARAGQIQRWAAECVFIHKDGRRKWFLNSSFEIHNSKETAERSVGFLQDITEKKLNEHILLSENIILEKIMLGESIESIAMTLAKKYEEVFPQAYCSLMRYDEATTRLYDLASPSLPKRYIEQISGVKAGAKTGSCGRAVYFNKQVITVDIEQDPLWEEHRKIARSFRLRSCWSTPVVSGSGKIYGTFAVYYSKARKPWDEESWFIRRWTKLAALAFESCSAGQKLRQNEKWFRSLIENTYDMIFVYQPDGTARYASPSCERVLGYSIREVVGKHYSDFVHPQDMEKASQSFQKMTSGTATQPGFVQLRIKHKNGHWVYTETIGRNRLDDPAVNGFILNVRDITDRKVAEEALRRHDEQMWRSQKIESLGRLSRGISHEFNNLLTMIYGNCELIKLMKDVPGPVREKVKEIYQATKQASLLTQQLRSFTRRQSDVIETLDINELVVSGMEMIQPLLDHSVQTCMKIDDQPVHVCMGKNHVQQILINLALNARDAMPNGGTFSVSTDVVVFQEHEKLIPGEYVRLVVEDTGLGMDPQTRDRIYEPFFSTKSYEGNQGLGLATVYGIVEQYKGLIECESKPDAGTRFSIYLPVMPTHLPESFYH